ncbi:uncharacterized protein LOC129235823 [Anastrepha obliqua]|uniref:uncharacterized protein LOC129235823 n=1 Tax=Anastrepha obliqua TaxID=95512 RepID=UPI0024097AF5|nr:uncharacterized protein LOC129235823 [Anastrepha obliqua]
MQIESVKLSGVYDETLNVMLEQRTTPRNQLHPSERQSIRFESIASQQEAHNTMDANATHIYTDGSKLETGACGSAFVVHKQDDDWTSRKFKLHDTCTVFQAEALAIDTALKWAQNELKTEKLVIYSDSRSCLEAIQNRSNPNPLIASIHQHLYLLRQRHRIDFYWVKSHIGIEGNERADEQAKEAANQGVDPVYTAFPLSYAIRQIRSQIFESWQQEYADDTNGSITKIFFPILEDAQLYRQLFGISFELTQLFTGHGFNKAYLKRFKIIDEDWRPCDQLTVQSMHHLLHDCPRFHSARQRHETFCAQYDIPAFNIKQISKYPSLITSFNEFVKKIIDNLKNFNASNIPT